MRGSDDDDAGNPTVNFRGEKRKDDTHQPVADPWARLFRNSYGVAAKLSDGAHVLIEHRHGLVVDVSVSEDAPRVLAALPHDLLPESLEAVEQGWAVLSRFFRDGALHPLQ